jgi:hypothetical protein
MKWLILIIEAGVGILALYVFAKYIAYPIIQYYAYYAKRARRKAKTTEEVLADLQKKRAQAEYDRLLREESDNLVGDLDGMFSDFRASRRKSSRGKVAEE